MAYRRFLLFNAAGGIIWAAVYTFGAYFAGKTLARLSTPLDIAFVVVAVAVIVAGIVIARRRYASLLVKAEAAYPEALSAK
jgi:membrane protein DedA with SNARE-associated domain